MLARQQFPSGKSHPDVSVFPVSCFCFICWAFLGLMSVYVALCLKSAVMSGSNHDTTIRSTFLATVDTWWDNMAAYLPADPLYM